jgi:hypothetical protein
MENKNSHDFAFGKDNYIILIVGVVLIALGYILMTGGGAENPNVFSAEEIFSVRRLTVAPLVILAGFAVVLYAVMKKSEE